MITRRKSRKGVPNLGEPATAGPSKRPAEVDEEMPKLLPFDAIKSYPPQGSRKSTTLDLNLHNSTFESGGGGDELHYMELSDTDLGLDDDTIFGDNDTVGEALRAELGSDHLFHALNTSDSDQGTAMDGLAGLGYHTNAEHEAFKGSNSTTASEVSNTDCLTTNPESAVTLDEAINFLSAQLSENEFGESIAGKEEQPGVVSGELGSDRSSTNPTRENVPKMIGRNVIDNSGEFDEFSHTVPETNEEQTERGLSKSSRLSSATTREENSHSDDRAQKGRKRQLPLESGLSGTYWQIENNSSWAVRPRRSNAGSNMQSLLK